MSQEREEPRAQPAPIEPPVAPDAASEPAVAPTDTPALVARIAKMMNKVVQDTATAAQLTAALSQAMAEGFSKLQLTFAMLTKQVATNDVKIDASLMDLRKQFSTEISSLADNLGAVLMDRATERILLTAVADVVDNTDVVLAQAASYQNAASDPMVHALRMIRDKLLLALRPLGVDVVPIVAGTTPFDENLHECVAVAPSDDPRITALPAHVITYIYNQGYTLNGRPIRRARVVMKGA